MFVLRSFPDLRGSEQQAAREVTDEDHPAPGQQSVASSRRSRLLGCVSALTVTRAGLAR
jgi:hypothetical protein